jgi:CelD/BcsL family acetyltransferase involved in cellulose biosynthesis
MFDHYKGIEMYVERVDDIHTLESIRDEWNNLLAKAETKTAELSYEWQTGFWRHLHEDSELFVLVVREGEQILGIAPLQLSTVETLGVQARTLETFTQERNNYQDFIIADGNEQVLNCIVEYLLANQRYWDMLRLRHIPKTAATACHFQNGRCDPRLAVKTICEDKCLTLDIDGCWDEYARHSKAAKKARKKIAYHTRRLGNYGKVTIRQVVDQEEIQPVLDVMFDLHCKRWNSTSTPSIFDDPRYRRLYSDLTFALMPEGRVGLLVAEVAGKPIAVLYYSLFEQSCLTQFIAFDMDYAPGAPALLLFEHLVRQAFTAGNIQLVDFGYDYDYKRLWTNDEKERVSLEVYSKRSFRCLIIFIIRSFLDILRSMSHRSPMIKRLILPLRDKFPQYVQE